MQQQIEIATQALYGTGGCQAYSEKWGRGWSEYWHQAARARPP